MKKINLTDWSTVEIGAILGNIAEKCDTKEEALCNFACLFKERADGDNTIKNGEDYELHLGKGSIGDVFYLASKKGDFDFNFEFDAPTFKEFGYDEQTLMKATLMLDDYLNGKLNLKDLKKFEFTDEIKNKVLDLIAEEWLPEDYDYNLTIKMQDGLPSITLVMSDGIQVWVINQMDDNEQTLATFYIKGDDMVCATFPTDVMEVSNFLRNFNAMGKLQFAWDYVYKLTKE